MKTVWTPPAGWGEQVDYPLFVSEQEFRYIGDALEQLSVATRRVQVVHDPCPAPMHDDVATRGL